jgi:hypothetical protein
MKKKTKAIKAKARKTRTPAKRLAAKRKPARAPKSDRDTKSNMVTIHPSGHNVKVSRADAATYRRAKRTT